MRKELYLYSYIYDFVVQDLIAQIEENKDNDILLRINSPGGSLLSAYGLFKKVKEHGKVDMQVDGSAMSSAAYLLLYSSNVTVMDVSRIIFHRADMMIENADEQEYLNGINDDLKAQFKMKIDANNFKEVSGISVNEMFDPEKRIDVVLNGKQAKTIGLAKTIEKLTPAAAKQITALNAYYSVAAHKNEPIIQNKMTADEIKSKFPEAYKSIINRGIKRERQRVEACMVFVDIDAKGVKDAIASGEKLSQKQISEFSLKALNADVLKKIEDGNAEPVKTKEVEEKTEKEATIKAINESVDAQLKNFMPK